MRGRSRRINTGVMACLALLGGATVGGLLAGSNTRAGLPAEPSSTVARTLAEMPPSETVNLRFPADWTEAPGEPAPRTLAFASADGGITLFSPRSLSPIAEAHAAVAPTAPEAPVKAKPSAQAATPAAKPAAEASAAAPAKIALASASSKPAVVAPKPVHRSNAVLNEFADRRHQEAPCADAGPGALLARSRGRAAQDGIQQEIAAKRKPHGLHRHEQDGCRRAQVRRLPAGHELQRRPEARAQIARSSPGS